MDLATGRVGASHRIGQNRARILLLLATDVEIQEVHTRKAAGNRTKLSTVGSAYHLDCSVYRLAPGDSM